MPIMDGYQFFSLVKGDQKFQNIPFFFISAKASYMDKSSGLRNGATKYLAKPISARVLLQELNEVLSKHS
jgi:two-component system, sensor histidine kinase and response regulator